jgi:hypothetical protein
MVGPKVPGLGPKGDVKWWWSSRVELHAPSGCWGAQDLC